MNEYIDEIFDRWVDSMNTTENRREHLKSQKSFHIDFADFLLDELKIKFVSIDDKPKAIGGRIEILDVSNLEVRDGRAFIPKINKIDILPPDFDVEAFKKVWEAAKPKANIPSFGVPMIFGTGGEQQTGEEYFYKQMWDANSELSVCPECQEITCECTPLKTYKDLPQHIKDKMKANRDKAELGKGNPMEWNHKKSIKMDLVLLSKSQYKAKDGSYKIATICIDGNFYALKSDIYEKI